MMEMKMKTATRQILMNFKKKAATTLLRVQK